MSSKKNYQDISQLKFEETSNFLNSLYYGSGIGNGHWLPSCILTGAVHVRMTEDAPAGVAL
ncbi:12644_t:CDS:2 [Ambispora leptoticha]|uniref:12644_t:CDS:1 n=1 Tax=Ambispora leptoticha TaxID=144679 RepID=A0A9N9GRW8_9GLOM|nr:12644_t:CDS:2 [Ambispora leptoticha]